MWRSCLYILIILLLSSCASPYKKFKKDFYSRKYPKENTRSYKEKKGLMLLPNTSLDLNKKFKKKHKHDRR
jgi:hypothetical protein